MIELTDDVLVNLARRAEQEPEPVVRLPTWMLAAVIAELQHRRSEEKRINDCITWDVTCSGCAERLDESLADYQRGWDSGARAVQDAVTQAASAVVES